MLRNALIWAKKPTAPTPYPYCMVETRVVPLHRHPMRIAEFAGYLPTTSHLSPAQVAQF